MNKKKVTGMVSWVYERAGRSAATIFAKFCDERKYEMAGIDLDLVRIIHTLALFEALRRVNTPEYLLSREMEVGDDVFAEYAKFLSNMHEQFQELAKKIHEWEPASDSGLPSKKKPTDKHQNPKNN